MTESIRVLHVDDEPGFADLAATHLERESDRLVVETATSASEGLDRLGETTFDCVISDFDMPERNGLEFLEVVRGIDENLPFVLYTGEGGESVASDAISAGVTDYLRKGSGTEQYQLLAKRVVDAVEHRRAKQSYREIFESIPDGVVIQEPDGTFVDMNEEFAAMFGYDRDELLEAGFEAVLTEEPPYTRERAQQLLRDVAEQGSQTFEWPGVRRDGDQFWTEVHLTPTRLQGEERVLAVVREIAERKEREREIRTQKAKVEALHDVATEIEASESAEAVYEAIVDAAEAILEFDIAIVDEASGDTLLPKAVTSEMSAEQYYEETPIDADDNFAAEAYRTGEPSLVDDLHAHDVDPADTAFRSALTVPIGEHGIFQTVSTSPGAFDPNDRELVEILVAHARERLARIEGERRLRERSAELEQQNDRLDEFVSIVSHDLRNPLNVADGHLGLAQEECESEHLQDVGRAHDRMSALIEDLLAVAREGERLGDVESVDLKAVTESCWDHVETADATLTVETTRTIRADRVQLRQLIENLLVNAVEHGSTSPGSQTRQDAVDHGGDGVAITVGDLVNGFYVEDDGTGIPTEEREDVFEGGYSTAAEGTGFGLSIVERVGEDHDWDVTVTEGTEDGARFEITGVEFIDR